jgi:hypothetical protein
MIFKVAPTFMPGIARLQNKFGFSQNDMKIVAWTIISSVSGVKANKVRALLFPELKLGATSKIFNICLTAVTY